MQTISLPQPGTILCLGAHADDIEIGCGGTLIRLLRDFPEAHVHWVVFSSEGPRAGEAQRAARALLADAGSSHIEIHEFRDRYFPAAWEAIKVTFDELSKHVKPDLIFTHHRADRHQDHRTLAELTWNAFRDHLILEYEVPKYEGDLGQPNVLVSLPEEICHQKIELLMEHYATQRDKRWFTPDTFWALLRLRGIEAGSATGYAEAFHGPKLVV